MKRVSFAGFLGVGCLILLAIASSSAAAPRASLEGYRDGTFIDEVGIRIASASTDDASRISEAQAISLAIAAAGDLADPQKPFSIQLCRFTDTRYGPDGEAPLLEDRLAWLVRFTGTPQPVYGPKPVANLATELNVVIDAGDGSFLEAFSYR